MFLKKFINFYKAPKNIPVTMNEAEIRKTYAKYRIDIFASCFIGYTIFFHLTRKNYAAAMPSLSLDLGLSNFQLGVMSSVMYFAFAIGKFVNGMIADKSDSKKIMATALFMSSIANILFAVSPIFVPKELNIGVFPVLLVVMAFFWGINGWFQSMGFPVVAKSLTFWWSKSERGTVWSIWTASHQLGTCVAFIAAGFLIPRYGWQAAFIFPGILNFIVCLYLYNHLYDRPEAVGLPDIESYREGTSDIVQNLECEEKGSYFEILKKYIFLNKTMWILAVSFMFLNISRFGTEDWIIKFLNEYKGYSLIAASGIQSNLPLLGAFGTLLAGIISDKLCGGKRIPVTYSFIFGLVVCIIGLIFFKGNLIFDIIFVGGTGFFAAGPCMFLSGICAVETSSKRVAAAATGFCGILGYIGAIASGAGTGWFIDNYGWTAAILYWVVTIFIAVFILLPLVNKKI